MDGTTEPIITVIGHPIAGNPTQFALERALRSLELDWRVLSFDVKPEDVSTALEGFLVTGVAGVIIDPSVSSEASHWYAAKERSSDDGRCEDEHGDDGPSEDATMGNPNSDMPAGGDPSLADAGDASQKATMPAAEEPRTLGEDAGEPDTMSPGDRDLQQADADNQDRSQPVGKLSDQRIDCLRRDEGGSFLGSHEQLAWVDRQVEQHRGSGPIWLGRSLDDLPVSRKWFDPRAIPIPPDPESIEDADLIVITEGDDAYSLEPEEWPRDDGATWVIDLTDGHPESDALEQRGYRVVTRLDRHIGTLQGCLHQWTGQTVSVEVIRDAIEEYLGV